MATMGSQDDIERQGLASARITESVTNPWSHFWLNTSSGLTAAKTPSDCFIEQRWRA